MENKTESKTAEQTQSEHERCDKVISTALKQSTLKIFPIILIFIITNISILICNFYDCTAEIKKLYY
jgi:16S rRNA U1498 N3-methylase RsmE